MAALWLLSPVSGDCASWAICCTSMVGRVVLTTLPTSLSVRLLPAWSVTVALTVKAPSIRLVSAVLVGKVTVQALAASGVPSASVSIWPVPAVKLLPAVRVTLTVTVLPPASVIVTNRVSPASAVVAPETVKPLSWKCLLMKA
ncbi:hypothetical protein D9M68_726170 [compost metagenome]